MPTHDIHPRDKSEKCKQFSNIVLQQSSDKVMATDHVRISIDESVEGQSNSRTHTQPQVKTKIPMNKI